MSGPWEDFAPAAASEAGPWDDFKAPAAPAKRPVGAAEAFGRSAMDSMAAIPSFVNALFGQAARPVDALFGTNIRESLTDPAGPVEQARKAWQLNNQTEQLDGTMAQVAQGLGPLPRDMGLAIMTGGGSLGAQSALKAAPMAGEAITRLNAVKSLAPELLQGAKAMMAPAALSSRDTYNQAITEGADPMQAAALGTVRGLGTVAQGALPLSVAGNRATRVGSSVALNLPANMLQTQAENAVAPESMQRNTFDVADNATAMGVGAIMAALLGPHAGRIQTPAEISNIRRTDNMNKWGIDRTDGYGPELAPVDPAAPRAPEPYAADQYSVNPKQATADLNAKLFPAPDEAPDLKLVPKVGDGALFSTKSNPDPASIPSKLTLEGDGPNRILSDGDARNIEKVLGMSEPEVTALPRPAQEALRDHANSFVERSAQEVMTGRPDSGMDGVRPDAVDGDTINSRPMTPRPEPARLQEPQQRAPQAEQPASDVSPAAKEPWQMSSQEYDAPVAKAKREIFSVRSGSSNIEVVRNPTGADLSDMKKEVKREFPNATKDDPVLRHTEDANGNSYYWKAHLGAHQNIEPEISKRYGVSVDQNAAQKLSHRGVVRKALYDGLPVQDSVIAEYPGIVEEVRAIGGNKLKPTVQDSLTVAPKSEPTPAKPVAESKAPEPSEPGVGKVATAQDGAASEPKAYPQDQATKLAASMTNKGLPSEAYPHPTVEGQYAIRARGETASKESLTPVETPINPDQKGASLGQEKTTKEVLTKTAHKEADPTAGIPKGMFTKVKDVEYDAGSGKKVGTAKEAMRDLNRSLSDYQAFLDCLIG